MYFMFNYLFYYLFIREKYFLLSYFLGTIFWKRSVSGYIYRNFFSCFYLGNLPLNFLTFFWNTLYIILICRILRWTVGFSEAYKNLLETRNKKTFIKWTIWRSRLHVTSKQGHFSIKVRFIFTKYKWLFEL